MLDTNALEILDVFRRASPHAIDSNLRVLLRDDSFHSFVGLEFGHTVVLGIRYSIGQATSPDLLTDYASLTFANAVTLPGEAPQGPFLLLRLEADSGDLEAFAAALFEGLLDFATASWADCLEAATAAVASFQSQRLAQTSLEQQVGLFGELLIMAIANEPDRLAIAWHHNRYAVHDFSIGQMRLEVKSSSSPRRIHWISSGQTTPSTGETVSFASLYIPPSAGGTTVSELASEVEDRLNSSRIDFRRKVSELLQDADEVEFDRIVAQANVRLLPSSAIPRPQADDPRILAMKWRVDLSSLPPAPAGQLEPWISLLEVP